MTSGVTEQGVMPKTHGQWLREGWTLPEISVFSKIGLVLADPAPSTGEGQYLCREDENTIRRALDCFVEKNQDNPALVTETNFASELSYALENDTWLLVTTEDPED